MAVRWLESAERVKGAHAGGSMTGGPPRMLHHITADELHPRPSFEAVRDFLSGHFDPHLLIDPFTGRIAQFLPFDRSAYALEHNEPPETNRMGDVCIQIEWYFTPGLVIDGKRYNSLADTPMHGWQIVLEVADSYGIPREWPFGEPKWTTTARDVETWTTKAGHAGHVNVPGNSHIDPGPMPGLSPGLSPHLAHLAHLSHIGASLSDAQVHELMAAGASER